MPRPAITRLAKWKPLDDLTPHLEVITGLVTTPVTSQLTSVHPTTVDGLPPAAEWVNAERCYRTVASGVAATTRAM